MLQEIPTRSRTKIQIWNTFYDLLFIEKLPFKQITINDICQSAIVHRSTFYNHFTDKNDLLTFGFQIYLNEKKVYSIEQQLYEPFRLKLEVNKKLRKNLFITPFLNEMSSSFLEKAVIEELSNLINAFVDLNYELLISKTILLEIAVSMFKVLEKNLIAGMITVEKADEILGGFYRQTLKQPL